jgi:hypothetical protein
MGGQSHAPATLHPRERPDTPRREDRVVPRAGMNGLRKPRPPPGFDTRTIQPFLSFIFQTVFLTGRTLGHGLACHYHDAA